MKLKNKKTGEILGSLGSFIIQNPNHRSCGRRRMSRALKFRAWDKKRKRYAKVIQTTNKSWKGYRDKTYITNGIMLFSKWVLSRFIIEQYTGLKDKNGKEIYEGDIIAQTLIDDPFDKRYPNYIVYWCEEFLGWGVKDAWGDDGNDSDLHFFTAERQKCEVIGNIHENPELIEKNDNTERR